MALVDLDLLKAYLRIETTDEDVALTAILAQAQALVEQIIGTPIAASTRTFIDEAETIRAYESIDHLLIPLTPIASAPAPVITDVEGTVLVEGTDYTYDADTGIVTACAGVTFAVGPYTIAATVGLATASDYATRLEPIVNGAILDLAADRYRRRSPGASSESAGGGVATSYADGLPRRTVEMLQTLRFAGTT